MATKKSTKIENFAALPGTLYRDRYEFPVVNIEGIRNSTRQIIVKAVDSADNSIILDINPEWLNESGRAQIPDNVWGMRYTISTVNGGKVREYTPTIVKKGKSKLNVFCQTLRDAYGLYKESLKLGEDGEKAVPGSVSPMLASVWKRKDCVGYVQYKINGVRCMAFRDDSGNIHLTSRKRLEFPGFDEVRRECARVLDAVPADIRNSVYLDGELYAHGYKLPDISGACRGEDKNDVPIKLYLFDIYVKDKPNMIFPERYEILRNAMPTDLEHLRLVDTVSVNTCEQIDEFYKQALDANYEGAMFRKISAYVLGKKDYHSHEILKIKPVIDGEFAIVGYTITENGKMSGAFTLKCVTENGSEFDVTPTGSIETRKKIAQELTQKFALLHGLPLIVKCDEIIDTVPQRGRTDLVVRTNDTIRRITEILDLEDKNDNVDR